MLHSSWKLSYFQPSNSISLSIIFINKNWKPSAPLERCRDFYFVFRIFHDLLYSLSLNVIGQVLVLLRCAVHSADFWVFTHCEGKALTLISLLLLFLELYLRPRWAIICSDELSQPIASLKKWYWAGRNSFNTLTLMTLIKYNYFAWLSCKNNKVG